MSTSTSTVLLATVSLRSFLLDNCHFAKFPASFAYRSQDLASYVPGASVSSVPILYQVSFRDHDTTPVISTATTIRDCEGGGGLKNDDLLERILRGMYDFPLTPVYSKDERRGINGARHGFRNKDKIPRLHKAPQGLLFVEKYKY